MENNNIYNMRLELYNISQILYDLYNTEGMDSAVLYAKKMLKIKKEYLRLCEISYEKELNGKNRGPEIKRVQTKISENSKIVKLLEDFVVGTKKEDTKTR